VNATSSCAQVSSVSILFIPVQEVDLPSLEPFTKQFEGVTFTKGTEIVFIQDGNNLVTKIDGMQVSECS
jgi:hypothetical protein